MKKLSHLLILAAAAAFIFTACEGPMGPDGPIGPAGPTGANGPTGAVGPQGAAGTAGCIICHDNSQSIVAKSHQYANSSHAMNHNAAYANTFASGAGCASCHVSQGFLDFQANGSINTPYSEPQQPNCYTCHEIHSTFTDGDWALTSADAHVLQLDGTTFDKGSGNQCANCHQARPISPMPVPGGAAVTIGARYGGHHGPVANVLIGSGLYKTAGATTYPTMAAHYSVPDGCVKCHMATPTYGDVAGGHTMTMKYEEHGSEKWQLAGCVMCHTDQTALATACNTLQNNVKGKLDDLEALLTTIGIYNPVTGLNNAGTYPADVVGAFINFQILTEEGSYGIHNPGYVKALLDNSIAAMENL